MALNLFLIQLSFGLIALLYKFECIPTLSATIRQKTNLRMSQALPSSNDGRENNWHLLKEEDSIKVFVKDNPGGYMSVRMELHIYGSLKSLQQRLQDVDGYTNWVYRCASATQISTPDDSSLIYRIVTDFPFPFKDRELTVRSVQKTDTNGIYYSRSSAVQTTDKDSQYAVIHHFESLWKVTPITPENLSIVYEVTTEPGGEIPAWLYNMAVDQGPLHTMKKLRELVEQEV